MESRKAVSASKASTSRKSKLSASGTRPARQAFPPSVVRRYVPEAPLAHAPSRLTALTPRRRTLTPLCCSAHCARASAAQTARSSDKESDLSIGFQRMSPCGLSPRRGFGVTLQQKAGEQYRER